MISVIRWVSLILGLLGTAWTAKLGHDGRFREAYFFLLFDITLIVAFVMSHVLVDWFIDKFDKNDRRIR